MVVEVAWVLRAPLRDGVCLAVRLYRPSFAGPLPVLLTMTPYGIDKNHDAAMGLVRGGYAVAVADCRGRGDSEGDFDPSFCDAADGFDMVEWLAIQDFCDGRVAMWGGSYQGENQWATAAAHPPHLVAIAPAAATHMPADTPWRGPQRMPYMLLWLLLVSGRSTAFNLFGQADLWAGAFQRHFDSGAAFRDLPTALGKGSRWFNLYLDHPAHDPFWQTLAISPAVWAAFDLPVLTVTGLYDNAQTGALSYLSQHEAHGAPQGVDRHLAVIGPWDHAGTRSGSAIASGVDFGAGGAMDLTALTLGFFDWVFGRAPRPAALGQRVTWFETGSGQWRGADSLTSIGATRLRVPLSEMDGGAVASRTWLSVPRDGAAGDPARAPFPEAINETAPPKGLTWLSTPLDGALHLAGRPSVSFWFSTELPDADLEVILAEVAPDGQVTILGEDRLRLRYRDGLAREVFDHSAPFRATFENLPFVARRLAEGSCVRLTLRTLCSIHFQRNFQGGGTVDDESAAEARAGFITVHHDAVHISLVDLPLAALEAQ